MRHYCTLFDRNYIDRGLTLYRSLERHGGGFKLHILCLDEATQQALSLLALPHAQLVGLGALQAWDPALAQARGNRGMVEFYFTCKPFLLGYVREREPHATRIEYLDSDLWFFSSPASIEPGYAASSVALSPHRFDAANKWRRRFGEFNAGWVSVSTSGEGCRFVAWWRERCIESAALVPGGEVFGDQKYLDQVPGLFPSAVKVDEPGVNLAPWNLAATHIEHDAQAVRVNGRPLVVFHFHGMRRMLFNLHESGLHDYRVALTPAIRDGIYRPYVSELVASRRRLAALPAGVREQLTGSRPAGAGRELVRTVRAVLRQTVVAPA